MLTEEKSPHIHRELDKNVLGATHTHFVEQRSNKADLTRGSGQDVQEAGAGVL